MLEETKILSFRTDAQGLSEYFLEEYSKGRVLEFPINPFQILTDLGISFVFRNFDRLEGLFFPKGSDSDCDLVAINAKRPITRQRFTAAHELCHYLKDKNTYVCLASANSSVEKYADRFASSLLMPKDELIRQIESRHDSERLKLDDVLIIAEHFGVSFSACYYRIKNLFNHVLGFGDKEIKKYKPDHRRAELGLSFLPLYEGLFDAWDSISSGIETDYARTVFKVNYIFNDSRLEGVETSREAAAEIVEDLLNKRQLSAYCDENNEAYWSIAGHAVMYDTVFAKYADSPIDIYLLMRLNRDLFSCAPNPAYGGTTRSSNPLVLGAKFETVDCCDIFPELVKLNEELCDLEKQAQSISRSERIERIMRIHHRMTVIHPFGDGNGRTSRAFMNLLFLRHGCIPTYVKLESKDVYYTALEKADRYGDYSMLYEYIMRSMITSHVELAK